MIVGLRRPIVFFDIEGTGLSPERDHIVSIAMLKVTSQVNDGKWFTMVFNPGVRMSDEIIAIHGITNEIAGLEPPFSMFATEIHEFIKDCDLAGYNLLNYDVPILWEEFARAGITWDVSNCQMIDVGNIFKKREQRSLEAAVEFYCGHRHEDAHDARADTYATTKVLEAQLRRYPDLAEMSVQQMAEYSRLDRMRRVDLYGKICIDADGDYVYGLHSKRGVKIKDDPSFAEWMLRKDFSPNTKMHLSRILDELETVRRPRFPYDDSDVPYDSSDIPFVHVSEKQQVPLLSPFDDGDIPF